MLVDKKIFAGGMAMLVVGLVITGILGVSMPTGQAGMTEEEALDLIIKQQENEDMGLLAGILVGIGFLLILISFGARRRRKGGAKKEEKKPAAS